MKRLISFLIFTILSHIANAQFNDTTHYMLSASTTGNFNKTNDGLTMLFNNQVKFRTKFDQFEMNSAGNWLYGKNPEKLINNDWNSVLDFNLYSNNPEFYYWGLLNYTSSYSLKINNQLQAGLGVAYKFLNEKAFNFSVSNGFLYEYSDIITVENENVIYYTVRNSLRLRLNYDFDKKIKISATSFFQPSLTKKNDYIISSKAAVQLKIWKWINFNTTLAYNKISRTEKENTILSFGLLAERFF